MLTKVAGSFAKLPDTPPSPLECDVVEIRLDANFPSEKLLPYLEDCSQEKLFTYRDYAEGGSFSTEQVSAEIRMAGLEDYLDHADYIDVELRNWEEMLPIIHKAREKGVKVIASRHDFKGTPYTELESLLSTARKYGVDILKFAFTPEGLSDIKAYQDILFNNPDLTISIMGMGSYAPVSRLLLAQSGSVLNYGYLGNEITAPGQWSAKLLKAAITNSTQISPHQ